MGSATKIDWCDATWNPATGCLHGCEYCYARKIAKRFGGFDLERVGGEYSFDAGRYILDFPLYKKTKHGEIQVAPYPFNFLPTFHRYRLGEPQNWKKPRNIFVCSMADLFDVWVPDEWIQEVFEACEAAPQHRYLFLTKNPHGYLDLAIEGVLPTSKNMWFGTTMPTLETRYFYDVRKESNANVFISIEPLLESFDGFNLERIDRLPKWIIVGAETGNRKMKVAPEKEWVNKIVLEARRNHIPIFMKESLRKIMGDDFRQEFPWEIEKHDE